jgi:hypothetical protein
LPKLNKEQSKAIKKVGIKIEDVKPDLALSSSLMNSGSDKKM